MLPQAPRADVDAMQADSSVHIRIIERYSTYERR
jgi:hypothetical protein